jgi:energy-coupling factor transport system substrate-specific component
VSWPLASFAVVGSILLAGWLAFERRRPSARMAAVVGVLAALAALGRDAFAALPDVKPITAMTLVVGYSLGPLPGFTVGALGMLVSNFMLGQGPYTPWQMAAWGMVGLAGGALGRLSARRLGRLALALACAAAALGAKEVMNLYTWTLGASHTPAAFLLIAGQGLPFDVTDTIASFLFGLAFAPELAQVLGRMRTRMLVEWEPAPAPGPAAASEPAPAREPESEPSLTAPAHPGNRSIPAGARGAAVVLASALLLGAGLAAGPSRAGASILGASAHAGLSPEIAYLQRAQNADGGFGASRGQPSSELYSAWAAIGLAAAGRDPLSLTRGGHSVLDSIRAQATSLEGAGDLERTILALHACGVPAGSLPGGDPVTRLLRLQGRDGSFGELSNITAFGVLALRAAGFAAQGSPVRSAAAWLARQQDRDGGFGFGQRGGPSDVDDTAAALQALVAAGAGRSAAAERAGAFLLRSQNLDGGFPQQPGGASNAQSTAWAVQGLIAQGRQPSRVTRSGSRSPIAYLQTLLTAEGSIRYSRTGAQTPVWVTAQALAALGEKAFPISYP